MTIDGSELTVSKVGTKEQVWLKKDAHPIFVIDFKYPKVQYVTNEGLLFEDFMNPEKIKLVPFSSFYRIEDVNRNINSRLSHFFCDYSSGNSDIYALTKDFDWDSNMARYSMKLVGQLPGVLYSMSTRYGEANIVDAWTTHGKFTIDFYRDFPNNFYY